MKITNVIFLGILGCAIAMPTKVTAVGKEVGHADHSTGSPGDIQADYRRHVLAIEGNEDAGTIKADYRRDEDTGDIKADYRREVISSRKKDNSEGDLKADYKRGTGTGATNDDAGEITADY